MDDTELSKIVKRIQKRTARINADKENLYRMIVKDYGEKPYSRRLFEISMGSATENYRIHAGEALNIYGELHNMICHGEKSNEQ